MASVVGRGVIGLVVVILWSSSLVAQTAPSGMVNAYRSYKPLNPFNAWATDISKEQDAQVTSIVDAAKTVSGQSPGGMELMNFIGAVRGWFVAHVVSAPKPQPVDYAARVRAIDGATVTEWSAAAGQLGLGPKDRILVVLAIAFNDPLWSGSSWRGAHPKSALARLKSLPKSAADAWVEATGEKETPFVAVFSLLAVDSLFPSDSFSQAAFQAALPATKPLLSVGR